SPQGRIGKTSPTRLTVGEGTQREHDSFHILAGQHAVAKLPPTGVHQAHRMLVQVVDLKPQQPAMPIVIEFSMSPKFDSVHQSVPLTVLAGEDVTGGVNGSKRVYEILYFAASQTDFVRIKNLADASSLMIRSVELLAVDPNPSTSKSTAAGRQSLAATKRDVSLDLTDANWPTELTTDYGDLVTRRGFSPATESCYRLWKAVERLPQHARWYGYDTIRFPIALPSDRWFAGGANNQPADQVADQAISEEQPGMQWTSALRMQAFHRWFDASQCRAIGKATAVSPRTVADGQTTLVVPMRGGPVSDLSGGATLPKRKITQAVARNAADRLVLAARQLPQAITCDARELLREFQHMPLDAQAVVATDSESEFVHLFVSSASSPNELNATLVNDAPWPSQVELSYAGGAAKSLQRCCQLDRTGVSLTLDDRSDDPLTIATVVLPPLSITNWRWDQHRNHEREQDGLRAWKVSVGGGRDARNKIKGHVSKIVGKIGELAQPPDYRVLRNGGFELSGQVGVVGWMHTQFPETAVVLDPSEAIEGKQSIRLTTVRKSAGQSWLV
ncbi:MAG: hypothetical protein AAF745_19535, partial [Planctomycetota bacterium]